MIASSSAGTASQRYSAWSEQLLRAEAEDRVPAHRVAVGQRVLEVERHAASVRGPVQHGQRPRGQHALGRAQRHVAARRRARPGRSGTPRRRGRRSGPGPGHHAAAMRVERPVARIEEDEAGQLVEVRLARGGRGGGVVEPLADRREVVVLAVGREGLQVAQPRGGHQPWRELPAGHELVGGVLVEETTCGRREACPGPARSRSRAAGGGSAARCRGSGDRSPISPALPARRRRPPGGGGGSSWPRCGRRPAWKS
mgnify:CR=1 FL=1